MIHFFFSSFGVRWKDVPVKIKHATLGVVWASWCQGHMLPKVLPTGRWHPGPGSLATPASPGGPFFTAGRHGERKVAARESQKQEGLQKCIE